MPTDAFTRAVADLKPLLGEYSPEHLRAEAVRIVLRAIREPDEAMVTGGQFTAGEAASAGLSMSAPETAPIRTAKEVSNVYTAMIDAILIQDPEIPVVGRLVADGPYTKQLREEADRQLKARE